MSYETSILEQSAGYAPELLDYTADEPPIDPPEDDDHGDRRGPRPQRIDVAVSPAM